MRSERGAIEATATSWASGWVCTWMRPQGSIYGWDRLAATELSYTRYDKVVEALGGYGELVERPEDLRPALERAAASGKPALINVVIRQDRAMKEGAIYV